MQDYLTFEEYKHKLGGTVNSPEFKKLLFRVTLLIDNATQGRIKKMESVPEAVKYLCRDLIEYTKNDVPDVKNVQSKSQSAGGLSESESYTVKNADEKAADIDEMMCNYLLSIKDDNGIPLLYRGCGV